MKHRQHTFGDATRTFLMLGFFNFLPTRGLKKIFPAKGGQFVGPTGMAIVLANFPFMYFDLAPKFNGWIGLTEFGALVCIIYAMHGWRRRPRREL